MPYHPIGVYQQTHQPFHTNDPTGFVASMQALRCGIYVSATHTGLPGKVMKEHCPDWTMAAKFAAACMEEFNRQLAPKTYEQEQQETCGFLKD